MTRIGQEEEVWLSGKVKPRVVVFDVPKLLSINEIKRLMNCDSMVFITSFKKLFSL